MTEAVALGLGRLTRFLTMFCKTWTKGGQLDLRIGLAALLVAFFALGFFAAGLLSVFWLIAVVGPSALASLVLAVLQGDTVLHAFGMSLAGFALAQVGYGLGLLRVAALRDRPIPD